MGSAPRYSRIRRLASWRESLASRLWPIPATAVVGAVAVGIFLPMLDAEIDAHLPTSLASVLFSGGTDAARAVLSSIAGSLITATSLTFSLTIVALQLASTQGSPRLLRLFAADRMVHATLALFLATFAYALTVLRVIADSEDAPFIPRISVTLASLLTFASVIMLTIFLGHLARQLRVETMLRDVHQQADATLKLLVSTELEGTDALPPRPPRPLVVEGDSSGFVTLVDRPALLALGRDEDIVVAELHPVGESVIAGTPLAEWWDRGDEHSPASRDRVARIERRIRAAHHVDYERTTAQDVGLGVRQLADVAIKALSPGVNDPTTAVHALSHLTALLRDIAQWPQEPAALVDDDGVARLLPRRHDFDALLSEALDQVRLYGAGDPAVVTRLYACLRQLAHRLPAAHRAALERQRTRLDAAVSAQPYDGDDRARFAVLSAEVARTS
ncbi:DUF2254 domain-containing protein [Microbacterium sp. NPDC091313]